MFRNTLHVALELDDQDLRKSPIEDRRLRRTLTILSCAATIALRTLFTSE
jgi:hypothetical protein